MLGLLLAGGAVCLPASQALAQTPNRYAIVVSGASGEEKYATLHREWVDKLKTLLRDKFKLDAQHLTVLTEAPAAGESAANAANVKAALEKVAPQIKKDDVLFVMLIGHGSGSGADAKFNLVGPDLTAAEWNALLKPAAGRIAFVDASSASVGFLKTLAAPERVIISATNTPAQVYHPVFGSAFIDALSDAAADLDKDTRISMWEAFVFASKTVEQHYQRAGTLPTEHAMLEDTAEGAGRDAAALSPAVRAAASSIEGRITARQAPPLVRAPAPGPTPPASCSATDASARGSVRRCLPAGAPWRRRADR